MKLINAVAQNVNPDHSTFNVLLTFSNKCQVLLFCRTEWGQTKAYNVTILRGKCPCCFKPKCPSIFARRNELLQKASVFLHE